MDSNELIKKVRKIEIKTRGLSQNIFAGEYHSAFKGRGMMFSEVREYQYGDDIRDIDWNVTARHNHPYVKVYEEERELTVMLLVDVSASRNFGAEGPEKREMIAEILGKVEIDRAILSADSDTAPKAPGMKYRHYAPKAQLTIIAGEEEAVVRRINELAGEAESRGLRSGVIATDATADRYKASLVKSAGNREKEAEAARELYRILREFDEEGVDVIWSEAFEDSGIGQAVMNRLLKAAGYRIVEADTDFEPYIF